MEQIVPGLFVGNSNDANDDNVIRNYGINSILNVAFDLDVKQREDILTIKVGMIDGEDFNINDIALDIAVNVLEEIMITDRKPVLVCCHAGVNRSRFVVYHYLISEKCLWKYNTEEAIKLTNLLIRQWMRRYL